MLDGVQMGRMFECFATLGDALTEEEVSILKEAANNRINNITD